MRVVGKPIANVRGKIERKVLKDRRNLTEIKSLKKNNMNNKKKIIYGFIITFVIFLSTILICRQIHFKSNFIPNSFFEHLIMLLLSGVAIWIMNKELNFCIALPNFKKLIKPFFIVVLITFLVNIPMNIITVLMNGKVTTHPFLTNHSALQIFLFVFLFASITEEILFRGFFQNSLKSLNKRGITILKCRFSFPVIISAIMFGLAHLTLITAGVDYLFLIRIVLFTSILGIAAGYYQEKYENNTSYAIIVHMGGNLFGILSAFLLNIQQ